MKQKGVLIEKKIKKIRDQSDLEKPGLCVLFLYKYGTPNSEVIFITLSHAVQFTGEGRRRGGNQIIFETPHIIEG